MGDPGPVVELQGEEGAGLELGSTEDSFCDHVADGLLAIWPEEPVPQIIQSRPASALGQLVGRRLDRQALGGKEDSFFSLLSLWVPCSSLPILSLTLPRHTRHLPATLCGPDSSSQPSSFKVSRPSPHLPWSAPIHCPNSGPCQRLQRQGENSQAQEVIPISQHVPPRH